VKTLHKQKEKISTDKIRAIISSREKIYLKDNISRTGFATGIFIKSEFVKNCNRRLASRFLGMLEADSLIVSSEYNLLTCIFCMQSKVKKFEGKLFPQ